MSAGTCPDGHDSVATDYCDTCGLALNGPDPALVTAPAAPDPAGEEDLGFPCAVCAAVVLGKFCEACGWDPTSGAPVPSGWRLVVSASRERYDELVGDGGNPPFPTDPVDVTFKLVGDRCKLGRGHGSDAGEVGDLLLVGPALDMGVSSHQATFTRVGDIWMVADANSANGTTVNGVQLTAGESKPLADGDRIFCGAHTCLTVSQTA